MICRSGRDHAALTQERPMAKRQGPLKLVVGLLTPLILVFGGAGLAALGLTQGWLVLVLAGLIVAAGGVLWSVVMLDLTNPFDWF